MTRREFGAAGMLAAQAAPRKLKVKTSKEIASSRISLGFETLDRKMFDPERTYDLVGRSGVKWARCQTGWGRTEETRGVYDFAWLDRVVDQLLARGVQPWFNVGYGNKLYTPAAPHYSAVGWIPVFDASAMEAWLKYVTKLGERFKGRVRHFEIWNEPNIKNFWQPGEPDATAYVKFVGATVPKLRKAVKDAYIVGGSLAGLGTNQPYVEAMLKAGLASHCDALSYHPYRRRPEQNYAEDLGALRSLVASYKPGMKFWQGENGAPSQPNGAGALANFDWDETTQAKWLLRRLLLDLKLGVDLTSYFLVIDLANYVVATRPEVKTNFKGVLRATDYQPKASYYALQNLCSLFDGDTKAGSSALLRFEEPGIEQAAFERKGQAMLAYWYPSNLPDRFAKRKVSATVWGHFANPVLVNLLDGEVSSVPPKEFPLDDGPMVLCDASVLD